MGIYLNPGYQAFQEAIHSDIYVDKTEMILYMNSVVKTKQKYVSVSRPRRFGKTMAVDMLCAYYGKSSDSHSLFKNWNIAKHKDWDIYLGKFDVIRVIMTKFFKKNVSVDESLYKMQKLIVRDICKDYPDVDYFDQDDLVQTMEDLYAATGKQFIIVIDEWDAVFRVRKEDKNGQTEYLDFLRDLLKDKEYIALAYMTGILPIKKYGEHSALNMFDEYSMIQPMQLAGFTGFTEAEVKKLCNEYEMSYDEISSWYDGYLISDRIPVEKRSLYRQGKYEEHKIFIYNPLSVVKAMMSGVIENYWNNTETYEALAEYIRKDFDGLKETTALLMDGARVKVNLSKYQNDMTTFRTKEDILALLIHLGYLGYDNDNEEVFIPNREVLEVFKDSTDTVEWTDTFTSFRSSLELLKATWKCDEKRVAELIEAAHDKAGNKTYNDEAALSYAIRLAYYAAQKYYTTIKELDTGKGYADLVYLPSPKYSDKPALLIELKYGKSTEDAMKQIQKESYLSDLEHYRGNILVIAVNYDKEISNKQNGFKHHSCKIEKA